MFEVGKQYKGVITGRIIEVIAVGKEKTFVRTIEPGVRIDSYVKDQEDTIENHYFETGWSYLPPEVIKTVTVDIWRGGANDEFMLYPRSEFNPPAPPTFRRIGAIEITDSSKTGLTTKVVS